MQRGWLGEGVGCRAENLVVNEARRRAARQETRVAYTCQAAVPASGAVARLKAVGRDLEATSTVPGGQFPVAGRDLIDRPCRSLVHSPKAGQPPLAPGNGGSRSGASTIPQTPASLGGTGRCRSSLVGTGRDFGDQKKVSGNRKPGKGKVRLLPGPEVRPAGSFKASTSFRASCRLIRHPPLRAPSSRAPRGF